MSEYEVEKNKADSVQMSVAQIARGNCFVYAAELYIVLSYLEGHSYDCLCLEGNGIRSFNSECKVIDVKKVKITYEI